MHNVILTLIFSFTLKSSHKLNKFKLYVDYGRISKINEIGDLYKFVEKFNFYKDDYYENVDLGFDNEGLSFLDYIKSKNIKLFKGNLYILDFKFGNKINPNNDKVLLYRSLINKKGYYIYAKEKGRDIKLDIAYIFRA